MSHRSFLVVGLVALSLVGLAALGPALAADLDSSSSQDVTQQKVEFGSGWYVRGDIGVTQNYAVSAYQPANSQVFYGAIRHTSEPGYDLSLGGGYALTNNFRADITADFHQPDTTKTLNAYCYNSTTTTCTSSGNLKGYDALVNGYYDFNKWGIITPYIGAGVGVAFGSFGFSLTGGSQTYGDSIRYHKLAWAGMAGVSIDVYDHTKLDIGYRYLDNGKVQGVSIHYHEIRAGLRYMIDD